MPVEVDDGLMSVPAARFFGQCSSSPSGHYHLAWGPRSSASDGLDGAGAGIVVLAHSSKVAYARALPGPTEGSVADDGTFAIAGSPVSGTDSELRSTFSAFSAAGQRLLHRDVGALVLNTGISQDGRYAVVQLCNSDTDDGGKLFLFDLLQQEELFAIWPETGWTRIGYDFDTAQQTVALRFEGGCQFRYSFSGEFRDQEAYFAYLARHGGGYALLDQAQRLWDERDGAASADSAVTVLGLTLSAVSKLGDQLNGRARAHRLAGEVLETLGRLDEAVEAYEKAVADNPKVGVKKRLASLKSQQGSR
jgi:hypothetical protein